MKFNVITNFINMVENKYEEEGVVGQLKEITIPNRLVEDYSNNKVCIQCGYDSDFGLEMYGSDDIKEGLCEYCREGVAKIIAEESFVCDCCKKEFYGYPVYGGEVIAPSWSEWSGGDPGGFEEDGLLFCSENCSSKYYEDSIDYGEPEFDYEDDDCDEDIYDDYDKEYTLAYTYNR